MAKTKALISCRFSHDAANLRLFMTKNHRDFQLYIVTCTYLKFLSKDFGQGDQEIRCVFDYI